MENKPFYFQPLVQPTSSIAGPVVALSTVVMTIIVVMTTYGEEITKREKLMDSRIELSITKLLLATKQLLEVLNGWSHGTVEEHDVSDVYVRLGNEFNCASAAFLSEKIDISDLVSIPEDLRVILESTLAEEASPEALEHYLPRIRAIIINLLQGLKRKQAEYRSRMDQHHYITPHKQSSISTQHVSSSSSDASKHSFQ
ncbi:hypothetical protein PCK1_000306 [Pneumocystis canis]|nr:hypothetical protein PCK1_000306 [Pneumocystis canis]